MTGPPQKLLADGIVKNFGAVEVLKGVSIEANAGDVIALIGSSGSGKSTLLRCLNFLENPTHGRIVLAGETLATRRNKAGDLTASDPAQLARFRCGMSMVFQHFNLWAHMTAIENVMESPRHVLKLDPSQARERAERYLQRVGVYHRKDYFPAHLSGGEQQRVAIARALAMEPEVMLFDEPTSALDPELVGEVLKVMRDVAAEGRTMIVVTHEMGFAREVASKVVFLHRGVIEEEGPPRSVLSSPGSERLRSFLASSLK
jgi:arginine/ornithine transport system ATP-binding protein